MKNKLIKKTLGWALRQLFGSKQSKEIQVILQIIDSYFPEKVEFNDGWSEVKFVFSSKEKEVK